MTQVMSPGPGPHLVGIWTDVDDVNLPLASPPYSPVATNSEHVLTATSTSGSGSAYNDDPLWSPAASFLYESSLINVSLGRRVWGLQQPVYGHNGIVQGAVKLSGKCTHVFRVEVSLLGRARVTTSERGLISEAVNRKVVASSVVLSSPPRGEYAPTEEDFLFSIPFPSYVSGGTASLPPSYASWSPSFTSEVEYCVRVDVHRKGLRRHELRIIPIMYLPKKWPSHPIPSPRSAFDLHPDSAAYKIVSLPPVLPEKFHPKAKATMPTVEASFTSMPAWYCALTGQQLSYPSGVTYSSGHSIPLKLTIRSLEAPALVQLLIRGLEAHLVKRMVARSPSGQVVAGREVILSSGNVTQTDTRQEGLAVTYFDLTLGEGGKEQSWGLDDVIEVAYLIRVSVCCPEGGSNFVPTYKHSSRIGVATEPWGAQDRGLFGFGGFSDPAVGMSDARLELRPPSSVVW